MSMEKHYFLLRLVPPRPGFPAAMNAEETQVMKEHGAYLRRLLETGTLIVAGPVLDPAGAWGMAVMEAGSAEEVRAITAEDPTTRSGLGFRWEIYPMMRALVRK